MVSFIGSNNCETLLGAAEEVEREVKTYEHRSRTERLLRDRYAAGKIVSVLRSLAYDFREAAKNGPTPDFSKFSEARLTLTPESRVALAAARGIDLGPELTQDRSADDIANDLLAKVKLDNPELLVPDQTRCKNCDHPIKDEDGYRHAPDGVGYVHKYCPDEEEGSGFNDVDPSVSCTFCGYDLDADGGCSNAIDESCTVSPKAIEALEATVQEFGQRAGLTVAITPANDGGSFILFDGVQIGSRRTRVQALTSALERLSVRLRGMLAGSPNITFGICTDPRHIKESQKTPQVVYFNGDVWQCAEHRS